MISSRGSSVVATALLVVFTTLLASPAEAGPTKQKRSRSGPPTPSGAPTGTGTATTSPAEGSPSKGAGTSEGESPERERLILEARNRYNRGLQLYAERNFEAARVEFERAYQIAPSYRILYNIGLCYEQVGDYVQAQSTLQRYLDLGGSEVPPERKTEVQKELSNISPRIASARILINLKGAEVMVDDLCPTDKDPRVSPCGETTGQVREVLLNPGRRRITVKKAGYLPETKVLSVAGSDETVVRVELKPFGTVVTEANPYQVPVILGWSVTAAGALATTITGVLAMKAADDQKTALGRFGVTRSELDEARNKRDTLVTTTDMLLVGTGLAAAVSTYFTIRSQKWKTETPESPVQVGLGGATLRLRWQ